MRPTNKVSSGILAGAITAIVIWAAKTYGKVDFPPDIAVGVSTIITFVTQYFVPDADGGDAPATPKDPQ